MSLGTFVYRRGDSYSFRCAVPARLSERVPIRHLVRGLGTRDAATARFLAASVGVRLQGLWSEVGMSEVGSENEVRRLVRSWFDRQLKVAWKQFTEGSEVRRLVADVDDPGERRARTRYLMGELADQRLDRMSADYRARDYREAYPAVRKFWASWTRPLPRTTGGSRSLPAR